MARTTGPLFSLTASGSVGKTVVYSQWKGRPYVRRLVIPLNPRSADQAQVRNAMRCAAAGISWANVTALKTTPPGTTDKIAVKAIAPDGFAWNGEVLKAMIGTNLDNYLAGTAIYAGFTTEKAAWVAAAAALTPAMLGASQVAAFGVPATALTAGQTFFMFRYALYILGLVAIPSGTPPTYA